VALRKLPPLNALRSFEVAARCQSFTRAASELLVTPAAVGQQVRQLEEFMGVRLFRRQSRLLALTRAGEACLPGIRDGFAQLAAAVNRVKPQTQSGRLTVSVAPSFAAKWLLPRLCDFEQSHPDIDIHVDASIGLANFHDDGMDLAIRYGTGQYPGLHVERLLGEELFPVCSPLVLGDGPLETPQDLGRYPLLHDDSPDNDPSCPSWSMWLRAAGVENLEATRGPRFSQSSLVIEAAVLGRGIALAKASIAAVDLAAGRLLRLFNMRLPLAFAYYLVSPQAVGCASRVAAFRQWLLEQAADAGSDSQSGIGTR
jgi:LysR family glycine cleavage system transcriptional activator